MNFLAFFACLGIQCVIIRKQINMINFYNAMLSIYIAGGIVLILLALLVILAKINK